MSTHQSVEALRDMITRDQAFFQAQSQRLAEIQQSDPNTLSDADKNALSNWDKSVVTDCNRQLLLLEEIEQPTVEQRAIMKELNKLITLGDHIMERRNLVHTELNDRLNALKKSKAGKSSPVGNEKAKSVKSPTQGTSADTKEDANPVTSASTPDSKPVAVPSASPSDQIPSVSTDHNADTAKNTEAHGGDKTVIDPKVLYDILKVEPDASLNDIKKAAKKATLRLHPDLAQDDPNASARFSDFQAACEIFESEDRRREFNDTGDVKEIEDLHARLKGLMIE